ncbi:hypothetical protein LJC14_06475 [Treponema sp. OttesenSCG-928-L16]|nr:hypothetical protein [Treponema sp. OttesenSCG-928-L16]
MKKSNGNSRRRNAAVLAAILSITGIAVPTMMFTSCKDGPTDPTPKDDTRLADFNADGTMIPVWLEYGVASEGQVVTHLNTVWGSMNVVDKASFTSSVNKIMITANGTGINLSNKVLSIAGDSTEFAIGSYIMGNIVAYLDNAKQTVRDSMVRSHGRQA